jgi:hypothetical protein
MFWNALGEDRDEAVGALDLAELAAGERGGEGIRRRLET